MMDILLIYQFYNGIVEKLCLTLLGMRKGQYCKNSSVFLSGYRTPLCLPGDAHFWSLRLRALLVMIPAIYSADLRRGHTKKWRGEIYSQTVTKRKWDRKCVSVASSINSPSLQGLHAKNCRMAQTCCFVTVTLCCGLSLMDNHTAWSLFVRVSFKHAVIQTINRHSRRGQFRLLFQIGATPGNPPFFFRQVRVQSGWTRAELNEARSILW